MIACCGATESSGPQDVLDSAPDWQRVLELAEHHRLLPALWRAMGPAPRVSGAIRERWRISAWRALRLTAELKRVAEHLGRRGMDFLAHKGPALGQLLYGDPAARQFGDLDVLVKSGDVALAREALRDLGYEPTLRLSAQQERAYLRSGYEYAFALGPERHLLELQWQIVPPFYAIDFDMEAIFERSIEIEVDGMRMRTLGYEDLVLVLSVHAAKHEWPQLGMLRDIAILAKRDLDWKWIVAQAKHLGISTILQISLAAAQSVFQIEPPEIAAHVGAETGITEKVQRIVGNLPKDYEPHTESLSYFRNQLQLRERWQDQVRFIWRLATTPGVSEWKSLKVPDGAFGLYRAIRMARLIRRFVPAL